MKVSKKLSPLLMKTGLSSAGKSEFFLSFYALKIYKTVTQKKRETENENEKARTQTFSSIIWPQRQKKIFFRRQPKNNLKL